MRSSPIEVPGDKSLGHRSLLFAALAGSPSRLVNLPNSGDIRSMAGALRRFGVAISPVSKGKSVTVEGVGLQGFIQPDGSIHCGNAGTAVRLLLGVAAGLPFVTRFTGDRSLRKRPMRRVTGPLVEMGAEVTEFQGDGLPLEIAGGHLREFSFKSPLSSAQVKSAVLLAGLIGSVKTTVIEPLASRDHTERMLRWLGVNVEQENSRAVTIHPVSGFSGFNATIPGDPSSAAFLLGAVLIGSQKNIKVQNVLLNPGRIGFLQVLKNMGADIEMVVEGEALGEPVGSLFGKSSELNGTEVPAEMIPALIDEIPLLAALATRANGCTVFHEVGELRWKESDRLTLLAKNINAIGCRVEVEGDNLIVYGATKPPTGTVDTGGDHRMAMAFAVLQRLPGASMELSETVSPSISFPGFFALLDSVMTR